MNHDSPDNGGNGDNSQNDRVILDYLDEILRDPKAEPAAQESVVRAPLAAPDNIAAFDLTRPRKPETPPVRAKVEPRQPVTLPFRAAEKTKVLTSPALLNLSPAPAPEVIEVPAEAIEIPATAAVPVDEKPATEEIAAEEIVAPIPEQEAPPEQETPVAFVQPVAPEPEPVREPTTQLPDLGAESDVAAALLPPVQEWHDNGRPAWAQGRFECLIFTVAGLKLAVPLITLGAIHRIDRKFNALPHQSDWFLGILQTSSAGNIKVLDTALCVMPERYDPAGRDNLGYVITIHGYPWGLSCHQVEKSITLEPHQVKWRTQRGRRPWLAGTVIDHMCALIDTDGFRDLILKAERPR